MCRNMPCDLLPAAHDLGPGDERAQRRRGRRDDPGDGRGAVAPRYDNTAELRRIEVERQKRGLVALEEIRSKPPEHELPADVARVVWACGWAHMAEHAWWRRSLLEALETMSVDDLRTVLDAWNAAKPGKRPPRRELWYRGAKYRRSMEFVDAALGRRQQARSGGVAYAMDGGLSS